MTLEATTVGIGAPPTRQLPPIAAGARAGLNVAPNATLIERHDLTGSIARFRIRPDEVAPAVEPGQYLALGLPVDGRLLQRPYSTATPRGAHRELEFLVRLVPDGAFTPRLWDLGVGDRLRLGRPKGLFTLLPDDRRTHLFIATGTGLAPFVSMLETLLAEREPPRAVVLHGVARATELAYRERFIAWAAEGHKVTYLPAVSRPADPVNLGWGGAVGRIDALLDAVCAAEGLDPRGTVAYLCGNPEMIAAGQRILAGQGFPTEAIRSEHYWPAGSTPGASPTG